MRGRRAMVYCCTMKSWRTTLGGIAAALGSALMGAHEAGAPKWVSLAGYVLSAFGVALLGAAARDNNVTSKQAGAE